MTAIVFDKSVSAAVAAEPSARPVAKAVPAEKPAEKPEVAKAPPPPKSPGRGGEIFNAVARVILPPVIGIAVMIGIWYLATFKAGGSLPGPVQTWVITR